MSNLRIRSAIATATLSLVVLVSVSACAAPSAAQKADEAAAKNSSALAKYVALETATIPDLLAQYPGVYKDAHVDGALKEIDGKSGQYAVVSYDYTYENLVDHAASAAALEPEKSTLEDACQSTIFPAMRQTGVTGPLGAEWTYNDDAGPIWSYTCSSD